MSSPEFVEDPDWPRGFEQHERAQRRREAKWSFERKLRWLESAHDLVREFGRSREAEREAERVYRGEARASES